MHDLVTITLPLKTWEAMCRSHYGVDVSLQAEAEPTILPTRGSGEPVKEFDPIRQTLSFEDVQLVTARGPSGPGWTPQGLAAEA